MTTAQPGTAAPEREAAPGRGLALGALFFVSGALGLLYEVVWFRRLHLTLGVSVFAVGAVVSAFMLGLAAGSRWAAGSDRVRRAPLVAYAVLELGIALYAVAFPLLVTGLEALYPVLYQGLEGRPLALSLTRFALSFVLLLPPTFLMGASLPAIAEAAVAPRDETARRIAWLYAVNTLGGVAGTLLAGFVLLEHLGIRGTLYAGGALGLAVAAAAFALSRVVPRDSGRPGPEGSAGPVIPRDSRRPGPEGSASARLATTAALMAGLVSLASEVVWTRALVFFVHNSTYAFSAMLAVYLLGIAAGAVLAGRLAREPDAARRFLGVVLAASAFALVAAIAAYRHLPALASLLASGPPASPGVPGAATAALSVGSWSTALAIVFAQAAAVLLVPAALLGAVFPATLALAPAAERPAAVVGRLYAANAVGSVAGAVLGTFVLVAALGTRGSLLLVAWLPLPVGLWALRASAPAGRGRAWVPVALVVALAGCSVLAAPRGFYRELFERRFGRVVWFSEGATETVAVCEHADGSRWIQFSDGRGASGTWSFQGGWLYAHLPLLLHPDPRSAAVVCFGTGNTLGAASLHDLDALDGIELSPEVVKAAPLFASTNHGVTTSGRARIVIEDGRSYMLATGRRYDVVTEEPPLVHTAGVVNLYSRDFYELCSRRLGDDGILAVWLATWELEAPEMRMLVRAFVDAFPHASLWDCTHPGEWLLLGSKAPLRVDVDALAARMASPAIARDLARIDPDSGGIRSPADLLSLHMMGHEGLVAFAGDARPVTDDRSVVDFRAPRRARANFGLGEWVTGGLSVAGVGERGLQSELLLRDFDRVYTFRETVAPIVASYGGRDPAAFLGEVRARARARELKAARLVIGGLRRVAADLRAMGQPERSLEVLDRGAALVPHEARGPIDEMRAQLLREMEEARR
jgi:predicted membrane-bound spermidine synthase